MKGGLAQADNRASAASAVDGCDETQVSLEPGITGQDKKRGYALTLIDCYIARISSDRKVRRGWNNYRNANSDRMGM